MTSEPGAIEAPPPARPGVLDLYRSVWLAVRGALVRHPLAILVEVVLVATWFVLRTVVGVETAPYLVWALVTATIAVISPASGLVILAATAPFFEPVTVSRVLGVRHVLVAVLGVSVVVRLAAGGWRRMPWPAPVRMAIVVAVVTLLGVVNTWRTFPAEWATVATHTWLSSIGGAMILLVVGVWVAASGSVRFAAAAIGATTVAVALSLLDLLGPGSISTGPLAWIGFWKDFGPRLGGAIPSPNGMAALAVMPACVVAALAVLGRDRTIRITAAVAAVILFVAMYLTYSRAAILSLFGLAVVISWRLHRRLGQAVFVAGLVAGILLLPTYLQLRGQAGSLGAAEPGTVLVASDRDRITGWQAATSMFTDKPVTGQGFLAYKQLADSYGDPILSSPHNEWLRLFAEEGIAGGLAGLAFGVTTLSWLAHGRGALGAGILAGTTGYFTMATFNNPLLFVSVSAVVYPMIGLALVRVSRSRE